MNIEPFSPMEFMEVYLRDNATAFEEFNTETHIWAKSKLMTRLMYINAGEVVLGKIHKEWNISILCSGTMLLHSDPTKPGVKVYAPQVFETGPGSQKLAMAVTDCVFMNVMVSENETAEEAVDRMAEDTRVTKIINKEILWQQQ